MYCLHGSHIRFAEAPGQMPETLGNVGRPFRHRNVFNRLVELFVDALLESCHGRPVCAFESVAAGSDNTGKFIFREVLILNKGVASVVSRLEMAIN